MDTTALISVVAAISGVVIAWLTFGRNSNKEAQNRGADGAQMHADIDYIKRGVDDIRLEQKALRKDVADLDKRLVIVEQSTKSAHKRLDDIQEKERGNE